MKMPQPTGYGWFIDVKGTLVEAATDTEALELTNDEDDEDE